jgi:large subunit ribosomal protein L4
MYKTAVSSIFSFLINENRFFVIDDVVLKTYKTKYFVIKLKKMNIDSALFIVGHKELTNNFYLASRNVKNINICKSNKINPAKLINSAKVILTRLALLELEKNLL